MDIKIVDTLRVEDNDFLITAKGATVSLHLGNLFTPNDLVFTRETFQQFVAQIEQLFDKIEQLQNILEGNND